MSKKNVKKSSRAHDRYYTPPWVVRQCCDIVLPTVQPQVGRILEPSAGQGVFVRALRDRFSNAVIHANDVEITPPGANIPGATHTFVGDFLAFQPPHHKPYGLCVGNPPYTRALEFVQHGLTMAECVVFLLRQGFLSSAKRNTFFRTTPPGHVFQLAHRPSFTGDRQTDASDYCFVVWDKRRAAGTAKLHWLPTVKGALRQS